MARATTGWELKTSPDTGPHTFGVAVSSNGTAVTQRYSSTVRALNTWYHVAGVYNAAAASLDIYVNGVLNNGVLSGTVPGSQFNSAQNVNIGRRTGGFYFQGTIDEVRIYNRALTQAEIQSDMNTPVSGGSADTQAPTAPSGLGATAASSAQINLSWTASTDNVGVTGYRVERCQGAGCTSFAQIATPAGTTYSDAGLTAGTSYSYRVRATDAAGNLSGYSNVASATTPAGSVSGQWSPLINFPNPAGCSGCAFIPIHMHMLPTGKILMWQDDNPSGPRGSGADTVAYVWDVGANTFTLVNNSQVDIFCSGHSFLPDGTLLVAGGHNVSDNNGTNTTNLFNPATLTWTLSPFTMRQGRWYPTVTSLPSGEALVVSGNITTTLGVNTIPEVWQTNSGGGWRQLTSAALSQPLYPWMHVAPNGSVFNSGPQQVTRYLNTAASGAWSTVASHIFQNGRDYGSSVMYGDGKVLVMGGGPPTNTVEAIDLNAATPAWKSMASMKYARRQMSATILPNGKVLVFGGSSSAGFNDATLAVLAAEMWDPATGAWSTMASMQVPRMYHSNALLLPDGRVVSAGGGRPAATNTTDQPNAQIYSPPYLFNTDGSPASRPVISSAPTNLIYGQSFVISTPNATSITDVVMIRLGSFTHSFDANQRINRLSFSPTTGGLTVTAPANSNLCPPGHYMLFILSNGVPSVAKITNIHQ